jgi:predicted transcriptional regulator
MRADGFGMLRIAEELQIGSSTVQRIVREMHD